jgi:diaminopimelate epimerase
MVIRSVASRHRSSPVSSAETLLHTGDRSVSVSLPGGELRITWPDATAQLMMTGPVAFVFEGNLSS